MGVWMIPVMATFGCPAGVVSMITIVAVVSKLVYLFHLFTRCKKQPTLSRGYMVLYKSILHQVPAIDIPGFPKDISCIMMRRNLPQKYSKLVQNQRKNADTFLRLLGGSSQD